MNIRKRSNQSSSKRERRVTEPYRIPKSMSFRRWALSFVPQETVENERLSLENKLASWPINVN